ncbi:MAG: putative nucleic acid-binding Zn-ribbon protein [Pseudohongiellaceae bacterium]|jgi:predicted  nucleic acid-binding Zn-ribbon protein
MFAKCLIVSTFILSSIISFNVYAQSLSTAKSELVNFKARLSTTQVEITNIQAALQTKQAEITQINSTPSPEKNNYDQAKTLVSDLENQVASDPSKASELKNAQFKLTLADRKFKKSNKQLSQLDSQQKTLTKQLALNTSSVAQLKKNINDHNALIIKLQSNAAAREKSRLTQQRQEMDRLKTENEELKARQIAEQKAAEEALTLAAFQAEEDRAIAAVALAAEDAVQAQKNTANIIDHSNDTVRFLADPLEIADEKERLSSAVANNKGKGRGNKRSKSLTIRIGGEPKRSIKLKGLGADQFRGQSRVTAGEATFQLDEGSWKASIPEALSNQKVTFIVDYTNQAKPRIMFFLK